MASADVKSQYDTKVIQNDKEFQRIYKQFEIKVNNYLIKAFRYQRRRLRDD
jgi:hypothetical protein